MKRLLIILMLLTIVPISYAADETGTADDIDVIDFKPSANVIYAYTDDDAAKPQAYSLVTKHTAGNRIFATTSTTSQIFYLEDEDYKGVSLGGTNYTEPAAGDDGVSELENNWTEL